MTEMYNVLRKVRFGDNRFLLWDTIDHKLNATVRLQLLDCIGFKLEVKL